jgi:hypothetical protein
MHRKSKKLHWQNRPQQVNQSCKMDCSHYNLRTWCYIPLMATLCNKQELDSIECILISFKCHALGLNPHFPRAVLYGPIQMGGMELPSTITKISSTRINYFLYHTRLNTDVGLKLDASRTFLQMEIGLSEQVLTTSYILYGHLGTRSLIKTIWAETEPNDLYL